MSEFAHSVLLFSGDDGLPLEFNVQYAKDKAVLKPLIEHGGGLCSLSDDTIYLVSPGTMVLNVNQSKNLISTKYIYDCVGENCLLDTDEYRIVINEMEVSDISDTSQNLILDQNEQKPEDDAAVNDSVDIIVCNKTASPTDVTCPESNHDFDFLDSENPSNFVNNNFESIQNNNKPMTSLKPLQQEVIIIEKDNNEPTVNVVPDGLKSKSTVSSKYLHNIQNTNKPMTPLKPFEHDGIVTEKGNNEPIVNAVPDSLESKSTHSSVFDKYPQSTLASVSSKYSQSTHASVSSKYPQSNQASVSNKYPQSTHASVTSGESKIFEARSAAASNDILNDGNQGAGELDDQNVSVDAVIVSSSQPNEGVLDQFDNMVLRKAQENALQRDDEEGLSQSYTVSSSADAQVSPKNAAVHNISAELFDVPDSASQATERQQYINELEKEVEQILLKPSPRSIQDKITLVKYISTAKQLPVAVVLQTLQKF